MGQPFSDVFYNYVFKDNGLFKQIQIYNIARI